MYFPFICFFVDKVLRGFQRVELQPGEVKVVFIRTPLEKREWFKEEKNSWELEHMEYEIYLGISSEYEDLREGNVTL